MPGTLLGEKTLVNKREGNPYRHELAWVNPLILKKTQSRHRDCAGKLRRGKTDKIKM